ncbi:MAG: hypothetical protein KBD15_00585 [Candidatus Magasanikbacteria bacterium]|nr:hypothetical protein [Candidatus Magasanikbacteria bacterium]
MTRVYKTQLNTLKKHESLCPRADWVAQNKKQLFAQIEGTVSKEYAEKQGIGDIVHIVHTLFIPKKFAGAFRSLLVVVFSVSMAMGGWLVTVSASSASLPTDAIRYGVKLATEKTQVIVAAATGNTTSEAELNLAFATRRSEELKEMAPESEYVEKTADRLTESIVSAGKNLQDIKENNPENLANVAKQITEKTTDISNNLKTIAVSDEKKTEVNNAKKAVHDAGIEAIQALVTTEKTEEVKQIVEKKIGEILSDAEDVKVIATGVKLEVETAASNALLGTTTIALTGSSTLVLPIPVSSTVGSVSLTTTSTPTVSLEKTVQQVGESIQKGDVFVQEVKNLLEGNNVEGAIEKAKILNTLTTETQNVLVDVAKTIQSTKDLIVDPIKTPSTNSSTTIQTSSIDVNN